MKQHVSLFCSLPAATSLFLYISSRLPFLPSLFLSLILVCSRQTTSLVIAILIIVILIEYVLHVSPQKMWTFENLPFRHLILFRYPHRVLWRWPRIADDLMSACNWSSRLLTRVDEFCRTRVIDDRLIHLVRWLAVYLVAKGDITYSHAITLMGQIGLHR
jgi:hypothetical protein